MKRFLLGVVAFALGVGAFAQNEALTVPYVSRLRAEVEGSVVKLLWQDTKIPGARYVIYRYDRELTGSNWHEASRLAVVPAGQASYVDQPTEKGPYFYAVLVEEASGKLVPLFIPFRNVTTDPVSLQTLAGEQPAYADVSDLRVSRAGSSVELTFKSSEPNRELVIYRSTSPIASETGLLSAVSVGLVPSSASSFEDSPVPGIPYYYAVVDSAMLASGKITLVSGQNTTPNAIEVPIRTSATGQIEYASKRPRPLPFLELPSNSPGGAPPGPVVTPTPTRTDLSKPTADAVKALLGSLPAAKPPVLQPVVLDAEKGVVAAGGEEYALATIINGPFKKRDWTKALEALTAYLAVHHSPQIERRARFYLGEVYYFAGDYRASMLEFVTVEDALYTETQPWLNALFGKLRGGAGGGP